MELAAPRWQTGVMDSETVATLRIDLIDSDPPIWRELEVPVAITLEHLHTIVQAAMGWENAHLWEFSVDGEQVGSDRAARLMLQDVLRPRVTRLGYLYDMGDSWEHVLTLTKPRPAEPGLAYPRYLAGENPAPPEDCGGIPGFYAQLEALADPKHPDHKEIKEWFGDYDPNRFEEAPIRQRLARLGTRQRRAPRKTGSK